jgi:hypothetical protein
MPEPEPSATTQVGFTYVQNTSKRVWTMTHGKNTSNVFVQVYDTNGNYIIPNSIHTELNTITVTFNEPMTGFVEAVLFLSINYITIPDKNVPIYEYHQTASSKVWTIDHNLGFNPIISVYIDNVLVYPLFITHMDINTVTITFESNQIGSVRFL